MNCGFTEKISSLIDGELSPVEAREVERHLLTCEQCQEARGDFLNLRSQISRYETAAAGAVQNRALAKILSKSAASRAQVAFGRNWGYAAVALASIALVALIGWKIIGLNVDESGSQIARQSPSPAPVLEAKPSPSSEPSSEPSPEPSPSTAPEQKTETPRRQQPARRPAPRREPKPGEQFAVNPENARPVAPETIRSADAQTMTALHFEKAETLLRAFRNVRLEDPGADEEVRYERARAKQLIYQNMMLRREADIAGDVQIASLLDSLEPILLDIANLPDKSDNDTVRVIRERVERKNMVALLQVNSTALARALD